MREKMSDSPPPEYYEPNDDEEDSKLRYVRNRYHKGWDWDDCTPEGEEQLQEAQRKMRKQ